MEGMTDLEILRVVLARELDTINAYTALARQAQDPSVRMLLEHISRDEEEHVAECIQWISRLNPVMASFLARQPEHVSSATAGEPPEESRRSSLAPAVSPQIDAALGGGRLLSPSGLTIGSLYGAPLE